MVATDAVRAGFGVVMAVDACLKWRPEFADRYVGYLQNAAKAQPGWLDPWFHFWLQLVQLNVGFFVSATRIIETLIAAGLLLGFARRITYIAGTAFSLLIWATAEGFGGPYTSGATNIGPAPVYAMVFIALAIFARVLGCTPYSVDYYLGRRYPSWGSLVELAPGDLWRREPPRLSWSQQLAAAAAIAVSLVFTLGSLRSAMGASPPTPPNAAAAVTPLSLYMGEPVRHATPARLPPLIGTAPSVDYRPVDVGASIQFSFTARTPGVFIYHCGTPPVLLHMGNGMYGALVVDPVKPLPKADQSYVLVESEWYTQQESGRIMTFGYGKMNNATPDEMVFNGDAFQYRDQPLTAKVGQRVRWYVVDAGPNLSSAFHVIGAMFDAVDPDGDPGHALAGVSTYPVAPGQGVVLDTVMREAGQYTFVDHSMRAMAMGAEGTLSVSP